MGKTVPTYRMALEFEIQRWRGFRKALNSEEDRKAFDELMDMCRNNAMASGNVITINFPVKGYLPRQLQVSNTLIALLYASPRKTERVFQTTYANLATCFFRMRKRIAAKTNNPRIMKISFVTFRHWATTMLYHQTRNILLVKKLLGHKKIENTMKYTQLIQFKDSEYEAATAENIEEAKAVLKTGFEYVTEKSGIMLFRKPKRYANEA